MAEFGRRGISYTPFFKAGMESMGDAMGMRRERQEKDDKNALAQAAWMGDPEALQELTGLDPELAQSVEASAAERSQTELDRGIDKDKRFTDDLDTAMAQIGAFETYDEAKAYGQRITDMMAQKYPDRTQARGEPTEFTEEYYDEIRAITGGGIGKPIGVHFEGLDENGVSVMWERLELPNGRTIARKVIDSETGKTIPGPRWDAQTALDVAYGKGTGAGEAVIDLADESVLSKLSAEAKATIMPQRREAEATIATIAALKAHPGLRHVVGLGWLNPLKFAPGSPGKNFMVLAEQAAGKVFSSAYRTLKGGGPITDIEGRKASQAIARMETSQSVAEYIIALDEFEEAIRAGYAIKLKEARGEFEIEELSPRALGDADAGGSEATAIDASTLDARPEEGSGVWVKFANGSVRQY